LIGSHLYDSKDKDSVKTKNCNIQYIPSCPNSGFARLKEQLLDKIKVRNKECLLDTTFSTTIKYRSQLKIMRKSGTIVVENLT